MISPFTNERRAIHMRSNSMSSRRECAIKRCRDEFLKRLESQGYSANSLYEFRRIVDRFCSAATSRRAASEILDEKTIARSKEVAVIARNVKGRVNSEGRLAKFLAFLAAAGIG